ncbi:unnamed protein product, partial [Closterium sp. Yama58-4]
FLDLIQRLSRLVADRAAQIESLDAGLLKLGRSGDVAGAKSGRRNVETELKESGREIAAVVGKIEALPKVPAGPLRTVQTLVAKDKERAERAVAKHTVAVEAYEKKAPAKEIDAKIGPMQQRLAALKAEIKDLLEGYGGGKCDAAAAGGSEGRDQGAGDGSGGVKGVRREGEDGDGGLRDEWEEGILKGGGVGSGGEGGAAAEGFSAEAVLRQAEQQAAERRRGARLRAAPPVYFFPRRSWGVTIARYGAVVAAGLAAGMALETWIRQKVAEDGGYVMGKKGAANH